MKSKQKNINVDVYEEEINKLKETLKKEEARLKKLGVDVSGDILSDQNIAELLGTHPTPMTFSLFCACFAHGNGAIKIGRNLLGYDIGEELERGFQMTVGGQPRCSIVHDALTFRVKGISLRNYSKVINHYLDRIKKDPQLANYPEVVLYEQNPNAVFLKNIFGDKAVEYKDTYKQFFRKIDSLGKEVLKDYHNRFLHSWKKNIEKMKETAKKAKTEQEMATVIKEIIWELRTDACVMFVLISRFGFFAYARLKKDLCKKYGQIEGTRKLDILASGKDPKQNPTIRLTMELYKLRHNRTTLEKLVEEFGHIGLQNELEIANPRYWERSELFLSQANQIITNPDKGLRIAQEKFQKEKIIIENDFPYLIKEIEVARYFLLLREHAKFEYLRGYDLIRQMLKKIEKRFGWPDNLIFYLTIEEIMEMEKYTEGFLFQKAEERFFGLEKKKTLYVPTVFSNEELYLIGKKHPEIETGILKGVGVNGGIVVGEVVLIENPYDSEISQLLKPGKILATKTTDPSWSPYVGAIAPSGGLITEIGGFLSHGAIISRELGIVAVVNVPNATKILKTGMTVRMDGGKGTVEIL